MRTADHPAALWAEHQTTQLAGGARDWSVPEYGTLPWLRLPAADPRRAAAVIEAAELWRRQQAEQAQLAQLAEDDPEAWFRAVTADADAHARSIAGDLARRRTSAEIDKARSNHPPAHQLRATPGWPPIAIPGQPGRYLNYREENAA